MPVGLIAQAWLPVPPPAYGGTEAVVDNLARGFLGLRPRGAPFPAGGDGRRGGAREAGRRPWCPDEFVCRPVQAGEFPPVVLDVEGQAGLPEPQIPQVQRQVALRD